MVAVVPVPLIEPRGRRDQRSRPGATGGLGLTGDGCPRLPQRHGTEAHVHRRRTGGQEVDETRVGLPSAHGRREPSGAVDGGRPVGGGRDELRGAREDHRAVDRRAAAPTAGGPTTIRDATCQYTGDRRPHCQRAATQRAGVMQVERAPAPARCAHEAVRPRSGQRGGQCQLHHLATERRAQETACRQAQDPGDQDVPGTRAGRQRPGDRGGDGADPAAQHERAGRLMASRGAGDDRRRDRAHEPGPHSPERHVALGCRFRVVIESQQQDIGPLGDERSRQGQLRAHIPHGADGDEHVGHPRLRSPGGAVCSSMIRSISSMAARALSCPEATAKTAPTRPT